MSGIGNVFASNSNFFAKLPFPSKHIPNQSMCFHPDLISSALGSNTVLRSWAKVVWCPRGACWIVHNGEPVLSDQLFLRQGDVVMVWQKYDHEMAGSTAPPKIARAIRGC